VSLSGFFFPFLLKQPSLLHECSFKEEYEKLLTETKKKKKNTLKANRTKPGPSFQLKTQLYLYRCMAYTSMALRAHISCLYLYAVICMNEALRGARKLTGENLIVVWAKFSTLS
jgi:hypothetical protein